MGRIEDKLFRLNDEIARLAAEERLVEEELGFHRHLHDDASRDATVSDDPFDREDARLTGSDVARFEVQIARLRARRQKLEAKRARLLERLG